MEIVWSEHNHSLTWGISLILIDGLNSMGCLPWTLYTRLNMQTEDQELPKRVESSG